MFGMITLGGLGGQMMLAGQPACQGSSTGSGSLWLVKFCNFSLRVFHLRTRIWGQQTPLMPPGRGQGADRSNSISKKNLMNEGVG